MEHITTQKAERITEKKWTPEEILQFRKEYGLTRKRLGQMLGVTVPTIYRWETGRNEPYKPLLILLSKVEQELREARKEGKR